MIYSCIWWNFDISCGCCADYKPLKWLQISIFFLDLVLFCWSIVVYDETFDSLCECCAENEKHLNWVFVFWIDFQVSATYPENPLLYIFFVFPNSFSLTSKVPFLNCADFGVWGKPQSVHLIYFCLQFDFVQNLKLPPQFWLFGSLKSDLFGTSHV